MTREDLKKIGITVVSAIAAAYSLKLLKHWGLI